MEIVELLASPVHRFEGRPADGPAPAPEGESVGEIRIRAGLGIVGDRYFNHPAHRDASITVIARESLPAGAGLAQARRNILVAGLRLAGAPARSPAPDTGGSPAPEAADSPGPTAAGSPAVQAGGSPGGLTLDDLVGATLTLDSGDGPVHLSVRRRANPCAWMDVTIGPGAWKALRGRGGVRCVPLNDGILRVGPLSATIRFPDERNQH
ncbi:molybdenum cofactor biosysynthesis protein [Actinoplanes sp. SE50]|uniref:hypothetical protein n=1 Tax=unclassified Actinoplanes TaxID=2626549 RepID=UPI00023EC14B|nr:MULTISPECIES: hypothetical protein [unclassified Actinoplanes]AEV86342.1 Opioid growth factor receptor [Actinoplanes sp. SE50/110]ATO84739.1 molybdenum cofactor biosysynthesis protein [Actinoplanes sp. SE50]SLM02149.1 molybdenum cofactor biosysynthesis protein [Actinoplanes sp. SE50/110]